MISLYYPLHPLTFLDQNPLLGYHLCSQRRCVLERYGLVPYPVARDWQSSYLAERLKAPHLDDRLLLLEHPPVYTLGTGAKLDYLKFDPALPPAPLYQTERGGEVTYHCPGQLVGYPLLDLRYYRQDLHWYLRQLEEVLIQAIAPFGLVGQRLEGLTGVWVEGYKVAAIGVKVKRWFTMHGFALNVCPDLSGFAKIVPCGIQTRPVGSLDQFIPNIKMELVRAHIVLAFASVFALKWQFDKS